MFKRESEQPVKISFEEKKNNKEKRSLRERLSNIPLRRRVEAVLLAVVTVMASLSIDWSSLVARAEEGKGVIASGQSISTVFTPENEESTETTTTLKKAKISVYIPSATKEVNYSWKLYQNLQDSSNPESGVEVGTGGNGKIAYPSAGAGYVDCEVDLASSKVVLLGDETAAVVFTLTCEDGSNITYKTYDSYDAHYVKEDGNWTVNESGKCIKYESDSGGTVENVTLSGVPSKLALTAGDSYTFSGISWSPNYQRKLLLTKKTDTSLISRIYYPEPNEPAFVVSKEVGDGDTATVTVGGTGVTGKDVPVKVVSFELNGDGDDKSVFTYKGSKFDAADLFTAKCGTKITPVANFFTTTYSGTLLNGDRVSEPLNAGSYTMTIKGKPNTDYEGLVCTKDFTIAQRILTQDMFTGSVATVKNGDIDSITDGTFNEARPLVYGVDFDAKITTTTPSSDKVSYKVTITGKNNFKNGDTAPVLDAEETSGISLGTVVDHINFESPTETYDAAVKKPKVKFYNSNNAEITGVFTEGTNYQVRYNGVKRSTGAVVTDAKEIIDAGEYTATVYGLSTYAGSSMKTSEAYVLKPISFTTSNVKVALKEASFEYSDSLVISPEVKDVTYTVSDTKTRGLAAGTEYVLKSEEYSRQIGNHLVTVVGYGNYEGEATAEYSVFPSLLNSTTVALDGVTDGTMKSDRTAQWDYVWTHNRPYTYTGNAIEPVFTAKVNGESLSVMSESDSEAEAENRMTKGAGVSNTAVTTDGSKAYFILTLPAKYASKRIKVEFEIGAKALPSDALSLLSDSLSKDYALGAAITLANGVNYYVKDGNKTLQEGTHYTISYENNINAGTATITATGTGNYTGTSSKTFTIAPINVDYVKISINPQKLDTSGTVINDLNDVVITYTDNDGVELHPFTSEDFSLSGYDNNYSAWVSGDAAAKQPQVTLTGKRNLTGTKIIKFEILKETLSGLRWKLNGTSISGILGSPGTTVDLSAEYGYVVDFAPDLLPKKITLSYSSGTKFETGNYTCKTNSVSAGTNTITIVGKGNYNGGEYKFTYEVKKLDITSANCVFEQTSDGDEDTLPSFTLTYDGTPLTVDDDYTMTVNAKKGEDGKYKAGDGYTVTFEGSGSYTGTRTESFHIGKPFDSEHVFVTMYGPDGTGTVGSENRLTYFGNNDPYFILTSNKDDGSKIIAGPAYAKGTYSENVNAAYEIDSWSPSNASARHEVGAEVTVTFRAKAGNSTWYNPSGGGGITYKYKVVRGTIGGESLGKLNGYLKVYTAKGTDPTSDNMTGLPEGGSVINTGIASISKAFSFKYTTVPFDPEIHICYEPEIVEKGYATQCSSSGKPVLDLPLNDTAYSDQKKDVKVDSAGYFVPDKEKISASDKDKNILITLKDGGWVSGAQIKVSYEFEDASLSDADITFNPANAEYTYSGKSAAVSYNVKIENSNLTLGTDYQVTGYYKIPDSGNEKTAIDAAIAKPSDINSETLSNFGDKLDDAPTKSGNYVLVIGAVDGGHYKGYNIAKFSIATASFTAELAKSDFSVTYGDTSKTAPVAGDLLVTGVDGTTKLELQQTDETKDGYKIGASTGSNTPRTDAQVEIIGTGNYKGCTRYVQYKVVADISSGQKEGLPDFKNTNFGLTDAHMENTNCLKLILKNDGGLPFIDGKETRFDPDKLTLSDETVTIQSSYLKTTIAHADNNSGDNITSVGKKKITVSAATGAPVTGTREYYVEVFADISTADVTLEANGATVKNDVIAYTGQNISVTPVVRFRGSILDKNYYKNDRENGSYSYKDVDSYVMKLTGDGTYYYQGTAEKPFSIAYDLLNGVEVVYEKTETSGTTYVPLSSMSFSYTGSPIGATIESSIKVRVKGTSNEFLGKGQGNHYTLDFANDTNPGGNTASATINSTGEKSFNSQTVYFSIGGSDLNETETTCSIGLTPTEFEYDGTAKEPAVAVTYNSNGSRQLVQDYDYKVTYSNNVNVPAANAKDSEKPTVTITGINGRYVGSVTKTFGITAKALTVDDVDFPNVPFGGRDASGNLLPAAPTITVTSGETTLTVDKDYTIEYPDKQANESVDDYFTKEAGSTYKIKVTGKGNYVGTVEKTATQLSGNLNSANITIDATMTSVYDGKKVTFAGNGPAIKNGKSTLRYGKDYTIAIPEIINAGTYDITITALDGGDYYDNGSSKTFTYTVTPRSVEENKSKFTVTLYDPETGSSDPASFTWTGSKIEPKVRLVDAGISGHDSSVGDTWTNNDSLSVTTMMDSFAVSYGNNKLAGAESGSVTLTASGNYTGTITKTFAIGQDIAYASLSYDKTTADYDGTPKSQNITVSYNGQTLTAGTAYESPIAYTWKGGSTQTPTEVGEYTPIIRGRTDGGFYGEKQGSTFRIIAKNKSQDIEIRFNGRDGEVEAGDYVCHYNGKQQKPSITVYDTSVTPKAAIPSENYTVKYGNNINVGSGYVYVTLKGNYTGSAQEVFFIDPCDISNMTFAFAEGENGAIKNIPESSFPYVPLFKLTGLDDNGEEFELSYADSRLKQYLVIPDESKAKKPGKGSLKVIGTGNLEGTTNSFDYEIYGRLSESNVSVKAPVYTGTKKDPEVTVTFAGQTLVKDEDYSLRVVSSDQTGQAGGDVIVKGLGYFGGNVYVKYGESGDVSSLVLKGFSDQYVYSGRFAGPEESAIYAADSDGKEVIPADKLECTFASDVDAAACINAGATVTITSKATLDDGTVVAGPSATYKIVPRNISSCDIKQLMSDNYTGKGLTPPISVSYDRKTYSDTVVTGHDVTALEVGKDYSLSYRNNVYPGTAEITVNGKGNYTGTKRFMFTIKVPDMGAVSAYQSGGSTIVTWTARPHVAGYRVLYNLNGMTKTETTDTTLTLKDEVPSMVGVQAIVKDPSGKDTYYGAPKYVAVTR